MELTIEHLAAYLPYGLKYNLPLDSERYESIMEHEPFRLALPFMSSEDEIKHFEKYKKMYLYQKNPQIMFDDNKLFLGQMESSLGFEEDDVYLSEVKPILRQLSYLTKEIEHNGEKFVPIIELLKIEMDLHFKNCSDFNIGYNGMFSWVKYNFNFEEYALFYDNSFISFKGANYNNGSILGYYPTLNQYSLIQKLLSWHFDIYRLIETGLAINYNEINK